MRIPVDVVRVFALVAAGVTAGYLWRAALAPVGTGRTAAPVIISVNPFVHPAVPLGPGATKQPARGRRAARGQAAANASRPEGTVALAVSRVTGTQPISRPVARPPSQPVPPPPAGGSTAPPPPEGVPTTPATPPSTADAVVSPAQVTIFSAAVQSTPEVTNTPPPPPPPSESDQGGPGLGRGDETHDHSGPTGHDDDGDDEGDDHSEQEHVD